MKKYFILFLIVTSLSQQAHGSETPSQPVHLNLKTVLKLADGQSPSTLIARDSVQQIIAQINDKKSILYPQINADISEKRRTSDMRSSGIIVPGIGDPLVGPYNNFDARIKVTQRIFDLELIKRLEWLRQGKIVTEIQTEKIEQDILALAAAQYVQAVRSQQMLELTRSMLARDYRHLEIISKQFELGTATDVELSQSRAQYLQALQQGRNARRQWMKSRSDLMSTLGISPDQDVVIEDWKTEEIPRQSVGVDQSASADIRLAQAKLKQSQQLVASEKASYWPKLSVAADYGAAGEGPSPKDSSETYTMEVAASIPIFDAGGRRNRLKTAEIEQQMNQLKLDDAKRRNDADKSVDRQAVMDARAEIRQADQQWRLARQQFNVARRRFQIGSGNEQDLLASRVVMLNAQDQKREAEALYVMSEVSLAHTLGHLNDWIDR